MADMNLTLGFVMHASKWPLVEHDGSTYSSDLEEWLSLNHSSKKQRPLRTWQVDTTNHWQSLRQRLALVNTVTLHPLVSEGDAAAGRTMRGQHTAACFWDLFLYKLCRWERGAELPGAWHACVEALEKQVVGWAPRRKPCGQGCLEGYAEELGREQVAVLQVLVNVVTGAVFASLVGSRVAMTRYSVEFGHVMGYFYQLL
ncbi:hypothetical protein CDD82_3364 [Ophiocordyceps australis]|uniref:Uncharacterized protein n=1 Tax=Ophiocordyceps australis TaxID=1399860 RepID=A0A2C5ZD32_9HYPO|nr:hypothetical protein CDD82_3364 [Ophiocordyceps australis]